MENILVVGPAWIGDAVMAQSLYMTLKRLQPDCRITVLSPAWSAPILARMPQVDAVVTMPLGHGELGLGRRWRLGKSLRARFDRALVLPGSFKSALVPWFANIARRSGYVGEQRWGVLNDIHRLSRTALPLNVQRFVALAWAAAEVGQVAAQLTLAALPKPRLVRHPSEQQAVRARLALEDTAPAVVLCPGAEFGGAKQWPPQHFAAVARTLLAQGWQVWLLGSAKERELAAEVNQQSGGGCRNLAGQTTLGEAVELLAAARVAVTNDSGLMHVAAAVGVPVVAVYGSSSDAFTPPLSDNAQRLSLNLPCQPCFQRTCPLGHLKCLVDLPPQRVLAAVEGRRE